MCICVDILQHSAPLPFLPQQLEEAGHSAMEIASVMGSYYCSGLMGGVMLTAYQIHQLLYGRYTEPTWAAMRSHVLKLMVGLLFGGATLLLEAQVERRYMEKYATMLSLHLACRFLQGFIGAMLFFYAYLLAATAFEGGQQVFALTACTIFLNVAEVFGPFLGAWIFTAWGMDTAYYTLATLSLVNNVLLGVLYFALPKDEPGETTALVARSPDTSAAGAGDMATRVTRLWRVLTDSWLLRSLLVIAPAAMVKSSFESILPLFGDNHGYDEFDVGCLFTVVALGFIVAAVSLGYMWEWMSEGFRAGYVAANLLFLGVIACVMLLSFGVDKDSSYIATIGWLNDSSHGHHYLFLVCLFVYGMLLGITHTAASLYLGEVIEGCSDERSKGAANGVWNTGWELGGSLGFVIAGSAATNSWREEQSVLTSLGYVLILASIILVVVSTRPGALVREGKVRKDVQC